MRVPTLLALGTLTACAAQSPYPMPTPEIGWPNSTEPEGRAGRSSIRPRSTAARIDDALGDAEAELRPSFVFNTYVGAREMDDPRWAPLDSQLDLGISIEAAFYGERSRDLDLFTDWLSWDLGLAVAYDDSVRTDAEISARTIDLSAGLLFSPPNRRQRFAPYVGAGWSTAFTDFESTANSTVVDERDVIGGPYARVGLLFRFEPTRHFGVDLRWRGGDDDNPVDGLGAELESTTLSIVFGAAY